MERIITGDMQNAFNFYLDCLKYSSECAECETDINTGDMGYWSKHNGVWCIDCGEELFSYSCVSYSKINT